MIDRTYTRTYTHTHAHTHTHTHTQEGDATAAESTGAVAAHADAPAAGQGLCLLRGVVRVLGALSVVLLDLRVVVCESRWLGGYGCRCVGMLLGLVVYVLTADTWK
jgi:hypothetical protein